MPHIKFTIPTYIWLYISETRQLGLYVGILTRMIVVHLKLTQLHFRQTINNSKRAEISDIYVTDSDCLTDCLTIHLGYSWRTLKWMAYKGYYAQAHHRAEGIMFSSCLSVCACVRTYLLLLLLDHHAKVWWSNKSTQLRDAFVGHARYRHDYTTRWLAAAKLGRPIQYIISVKPARSEATWRLVCS